MAFVSLREGSNTLLPPNQLYRNMYLFPCASAVSFDEAQKFAMCLYKGDYSCRFLAVDLPSRQDNLEQNLKSRDMIQGY